MEATKHRVRCSAWWGGTDKALSARGRVQWTRSTVSHVHLSRCHGSPATPVGASLVLSKGLSSGLTPAQTHSPGQPEAAKPSAELGEQRWEMLCACIRASICPSVHRGWGSAASTHAIFCDWSWLENMEKKKKEH